MSGSASLDADALDEAKLTSGAGDERRLGDKSKVRRYPLPGGDPVEAAEFEGH